jgi:hypothetical protein
MSDKCRRCGDTILLPDRFRLKAHDFTESTASWVDGRLCSYCWDDFMAFLKGAGIADKDERLVRTQVAKRNRRERARRCEQ